jgi:DNA repair ATPase RecN
MLSSVSVKHFQSLYDVSLTLGRFTVIVGPSSSGKSAFTRALRTLTGNQRGDSFISHGENQCIITATTDRGTVALLRGKKNEYVIIPEDDPSNQKSFTKLAGNTPEEVSEFIGIPAKDPLNYSNQFDMPYLLTASAQEVARTLGDLTNVSVIFEASREANRQRLQASATLKTRAGDYAEATKNLEKYKSLKEDLATLEQAEELHEQAVKLETRISRLGQLTSTIKDIPAPPKVISLPSTSHLTTQQQTISRLTTLIRSLKQYEQQATEAYKNIKSYTSKTEQAREQYTQTLTEAGTCPTCKQSTSHLDHEH